MPTIASTYDFAASRTDLAVPADASSGNTRNMLTHDEVSSLVGVVGPHAVNVNHDIASSLVNLSKTLGEVQV